MGALTQLHAAASREPASRPPDRARRPRASLEKKAERHADCSVEPILSRPST